MSDVDYGAWYAHYRTLFARAGVEPLRRAADVCCGTGAFAIRMAKDGISAVGVDLSADMLERAQRSARGAGVKVPFVRMDAAALELPRPVDAILCACDGVNYLASPRAARSFFRRAHAALRPGGALAFDLSAEHKFIEALDGRAFGEDLGDLCYLWTNDYDRDARLCHMELTIFTRDTDGRYARSFEAHTQRAHSADELTEWLAEAGFSDIEILSEWTMEPCRDDDDRRHVIAIRR